MRPAADNLNGTTLRTSPIQMNFQAAYSDRSYAAARSVPMWFILINVIFILAVGLFPYKMHSGGFSAAQVLEALPLKKGTEPDWEVVLNALLFIPFAFCLARYLAQRRALKFTPILVTILAVSSVLSYGIELLQFFIPGRFSSRADLFGNALGGLLGFVLFYTIAAKTLFSLFLAYACTALFVSIPLQRAATLMNWDPSFHLLVGNERTGDRPWDGQVDRFYIADRAVSDSEVRSLTTQRDPYAVLETSLIASYKFHGRNGYQDQLGRMPDLILKGGTASTLPGKSSAQPSSGWFETRNEVPSLTKHLIKTSQFTLGLSLISHRSDQSGPARIISLSADPDRRNFTLAQEGTDLVFRLRTPFTGQNGVKPSLIVPNVFEPKELTDIVITYNGTDLLIFVNGVLRREKLPLTPGTVAFGHFFSSGALWLKAFNVLYYGALFLPLGILLSFNPKMRIAKIAASVILPPLLLEAVLVAVSGKAPQWSHVLLGSTFVLFGVLLLRNTNSFSPRFRAHL